MMIETFQSYGCRTGAGETPEHCNNNDDRDDKATQMMMDAAQPWGVQNIFIVNFPKSPQNTAGTADKGLTTSQEALSG